MLAVVNLGASSQDIQDQRYADPPPRRHVIGSACVDPLRRTASPAIHFGGPESPDIDGTGPLYVIAALMIQCSGSWEVTGGHAYR
jgi:hypothetical protein